MRYHLHVIRILICGVTKVSDRIPVSENMLTYSVAHPIPFHPIPSYPYIFMNVPQCARKPISAKDINQYGACRQMQNESCLLHDIYDYLHTILPKYHGLDILHLVGSTTFHYPHMPPSLPSPRKSLMDPVWFYLIVWTYSTYASLLGHIITWPAHGSYKISTRVKLLSLPIE